MMRKNKENGKDGTHNIENLELKIKQLEQEIFKSKNLEFDDEESEENEFLDGISQIDGNEMIKKNLKEHCEKFPPVEETKRNKTPKLIKPVKNNIKITGKSPCKPKLFEDDIDVIKEMEAILGNVVQIVKKDDKLPQSLQNKISASESLITDLLNSVKNPEEEMYLGSAEVGINSCKSK